MSCWGCRRESAAGCIYGRRCWHPPRPYSPSPGASAVQDQAGPRSAAPTRVVSARSALLAVLEPPHRVDPAPGAAGGLAELIPIVSCSPIVIPDHKEPGGSRAATGHAPSISPQPLPFLIRLWPRLKMSMAPGSSIGSFRVLYIALIYMSLEINLVYTLPRHPPPPPPPLWPPLPPSPSGLGLHLSFPLAPQRQLGCPMAALGCRGGSLSPHMVAAREVGWDRMGDMAEGLPWGTRCCPGT